MGNDQLDLVAQSDLLEKKNALLNEIRRSTNIFKAMADPVRQDILMMFMPAKRMNVAQVVEQSHLSRPAISHHLKILKEAGILSSAKVKTEVYYSLTFGDSVIQQLKTIVHAAESIINDPAKVLE
ncbi:metalloregulator ArsR/SmtB family transcription factor [Paenibacillus sp. WQ 127069]|uniref:Metalloregulator ArsR/SmtB family transcription factor n=1 Tax=Paenibacillus baimaensis TaxID=2982185 RepID=A0ABT2UDT4_9BACL|nr:metalloregulator ArsR/SmtB family transcription factor [Paenibacillus sp. WQ 127069]MCU6792813.1 metalloregulator ArsR/SmtB family transcription factor [Paenibacillus sp. WQ 127069]